MQAILTIGMDPSEVNLDWYHNKNNTAQLKIGKGRNGELVLMVDGKMVFQMPEEQARAGPDRNWDQSCERCGLITPRR